MTSIVDKVMDIYNHIIYEMADPRVKHHYLLSSPLPIVALTSFYLYFCTSLGPRYMKDRKPYDLKIVLLLYNLFQVILSTYIFVEATRYMMSEKFNFLCAPVDYSDDPVAVWASGIGVCYFYAKVIEFLDTVFFVLRKKNNHISFLHVYHHSMMAFTIWIGAKYFSGGHGAMTVSLNSFVHIIMYAYYLIAGLGPEYQKYVWWKKHVTVLQLIQFVILFAHAMYPLFNDCPYPKLNNIITATNAVIFIYLFGKFFFANYIRSNNKKKLQNGGSVQNGGNVKNGETVKNGNGVHNGKHNRHSIKEHQRLKDN